jgi:hypothetical protein
VGFGGRKFEQFIGQSFQSQSLRRFAMFPELAHSVELLKFLPRLIIMDLHDLLQTGKSITLLFSTSKP